jgi:hypothetical protein
MRKARYLLRHLPLAALCAWFSPALHAAEAPRPAPAGPRARTAPPGCAKLVCQRRRAVTALDTGTPSSARTAGSSPVSVHVGLGVATLRAPSLQTRQPDAIPAETVSLGPPVSDGRLVESAGAALSFGVSLQQELASLASVRWGLEERISLTALLPVKSGELVAGVVGDLLVVASPASSALRVALGPSLGLVGLNASATEPALVAGAALALGLDLGQLMPGTLELIGHLGAGLSHAGDSQRDLQLALSMPL